MLPVPAVPGNPDNNNDDNGGEVLGPLVKSHVDLAKTAHKWLLSVLLFVIFLLAFLEWHCLQPHDVAAIVGEANFCKQLQLFIRDQQQDNNSKSNVVSSLLGLPLLPNKIFVYTSAVATFYAPSNISCITGIHSEHISLGTMAMVTMIACLSILTHYSWVCMDLMLPMPGSSSHSLLSE